MTTLAPNWDLMILSTLLGLSLLSGLAYVIAYEVITARRISRAIDQVFGWFWARRITALEPWYGRADLYRVLGPSARENVRR